MKTILIASCLLLFAAMPTQAMDTEATPDCIAAPCETVNNVCQRVGGTDCLAVSSPVSSFGVPCDVINLVCYQVKYLPHPCVK